MNKIICNCGHSIDKHLGSLFITDTQWYGCNYHDDEGLVCACALKPSEVAEQHIAEMQKAIRYATFPVYRRLVPTSSELERES